MPIEVVDWTSKLSEIKLVFTPFNIMLYNVFAFFVICIHLEKKNIEIKSKGIHILGKMLSVSRIRQFRMKVDIEVEI